MEEENKQTNKQKMGEFNEVFNDDQEEDIKQKDDGIDSVIDGVNDKTERYIKNLGQPVKVVVFRQRSVKWFDKVGREIRVDVVFPIDDEDYNKIRKEYAINIGEGQKAYVNFINGEFKAVKIVFEDHSFIDYNYPHIINFDVGFNRRNKKTYTILCGDIIKVDSNAHADILLKQFGFLSECDKNGSILEPSEYLSNVGRRAKKSDQKVDWTSIRQVNIEDIPKQNPDNKPITLEKTDNKDSLE